MYLQYWLPSGICTVTVVLLLTIVCGGFLKKAARIIDNVTRLNGNIKNFERCDMCNLEKIEPEMSGSGSDAIMTAWERFSFDIRKMFGKSVAPQPSGYFTYDDIFVMPAHSDRVNLAFKLVPVIALISVLTSPVILLLSSDGTDPLNLRICLGAAAISLILIASVFTVCYTKVTQTVDNAKRSLFTLNRTLTILLPTATESTQAALLLRSSEENTEVFREMSEKLTAKIDDFAFNGIAPMIAKSFDDSIEKNITPGIEKMEDTLAELSTAVVKRQDKGMAQLAQSFSDRLAGELQVYIDNMSHSVAGVNAEMSALRDSVSKTVEEMNERTAEDRGVLHDTIETARTVLENQTQVTENLDRLSDIVLQTKGIVDGMKERDEEIFANLSRSSQQTYELQKQVEAGLEALNEQKQEAFDKLTSYSEELKNSTETAISGSEKMLEEGFGRWAKGLLEVLQDSIERNAKLTGLLSKLSADVNRASEEQLQKAGEAERQMLNEITDKISATLGNVGTDIYKAMTAATDETAGIVKKLAETAEHIKTEYDFYFTRMESENNDIVNEMDYHMQAIFTRFSEEAGGVISKLEGSIDKAMGMFEGSTSSLVSGIGDEARSIGLYAKDLNIDVAKLTEALESAIGEFSESITAGTAKTLEQFDGGLSEINLRFANTIESIRESVENLPKALETKKDN